jgi:hypothetical protein
MPRARQKFAAGPLARAPSQHNPRGGIMPLMPISALAPYRGHERLPGVGGPVPGAAVREAREPADDDGVHASER